VTATADGYSVCEHSIGQLDHVEERLKNLNLELLMLKRADGDVMHEQPQTIRFKAGDSLVVFGPDTSHEALSGVFKTA